MPATAKVIELKGDPKKPESAEHIIKFPGGSISVCRTSNNEYWMHMEVNNQETGESLRQSLLGEVVTIRLDYARPGCGVETIKNTEGLNHVAVRVKVKSFDQTPLRGERK